jgi:hypothetical protein
MDHSICRYNRCIWHAKLCTLWTSIPQAFPLDNCAEMETGWMDEMGLGES